jgi:cell division protein FtsL
MTRRSARSGIQMNARLVRERDRARARELRRFVIYGAVIVAPLLAYVWQHVDFIRVSYKVESLQKDRQAETERQKQLSLERSYLLAPDRIERLARKQLGLNDPAPENVRRVRVIDGRIDAIGAQARRGGPGGFDAGAADAGGAPAGAAGTADATTSRVAAAPLALAGVTGAIPPLKASGEDRR